MNASGDQKSNKAEFKLSPSSPLMIEISLQSISEPNTKLTLELWSIYFDHDEVEANVRVSYTAYNRMSLLLKSLISITRVLPAYKLSRRIRTSSLTENTEDEFRLFYNVYPAEVRVDHLAPNKYRFKDFLELYTAELGDSHKTIQLGKVNKYKTYLIATYLLLVFEIFINPA